MVLEIHGAGNYRPGKGFRTVSQDVQRPLITRLAGNVFLTIQRVADFPAANGT